MRGGRPAVAAIAAMAVAGCIPQVAQDYRDAHPPASPYRASPVADDRGRPADPYYRPTVPAEERYGDADRPPPRDMPQDREPPARDRDDPPAPTEDGYRPSVPPRATTSTATFAAARPVWEARPASADAVTVAARDYTVRDGDTLNKIAARTGTAPGAIARANNLDRPYGVEAGQHLAIPGGRYHTVHPGEAGIAIARAYGVPWSQIVAANDLAEPFVLRVGERVLIPGPPPDSNRLAERAAAFSLNIDDILTGGEPAPVRNQPPGPRAPSPARPLPPTVVVAPPARFRGGFAWPLDGRVVRRFGPGGTGQRNDGIEIAAATGTPIHATADGVVAYVGDGIAALGGLVIVKHGDGWTSVYGHASRLLVQRGQSVRQGQMIALAGDTGYADRPELHFELRKGRTPVDPTTQLPRR